MEPHPHSTARFLGHPLHPMLVPIPIVCFIGAFICDVVYRVNGVETWTWASNWLIGVGLAGAALAAVAGLTDYLGDRMIRLRASASDLVRAEAAVFFPTKRSQLAESRNTKRSRESAQPVAS